MASILTSRQEIFVEAHVSGASVAESLKAVGYAPFLSQGSKLLRKPHIQAAIAERQQRLRDSCHIEREDIACYAAGDQANSQDILRVACSDSAAWAPIRFIQGYSNIKYSGVGMHY